MSYNQKELMFDYSHFIHVFQNAYGRVNLALWPRKVRRLYLTNDLQANVKQNVKRRFTSQHDALHFLTLAENCFPLRISIIDSDC